MTERMRELEAREDVLKEVLGLQEPADIPDIHLNVSGIFRKKIERLTEALKHPRGSQWRPVKRSGRWVEKHHAAPWSDPWKKSTRPYTADPRHLELGSKHNPLKRLENATLPRLSLRECRYRWLRQ